jgi:hypothetical protein
VSQSAQPPSDDQTRIIRRVPTGPLPPPAPENTQTGIIRRAPTGPIPTQTRRHAAEVTTRVAAPADVTTRVPAPARPVSDTATPDAPATEHIVAASRSAILPAPPRATTAVAACVIAMISGWATSVVATDLIAGWWDSDRLFCAAVGFLALVFAASTVCGVVLVLLRRPMGRYLIAAGAVIALLAFGGVFIAGAQIPWFVYVMPVLPVASATLALLPATTRWTNSA